MSTKKLSMIYEISTQHRDINREKYRYLIISKRRLLIVINLLRINSVRLSTSEWEGKKFSSYRILANGYLLVTLCSTSVSRCELLDGFPSFVSLSEVAPVIHCVCLLTESDMFGRSRGRRYCYLSEEIQLARGNVSRAEE